MHNRELPEMPASIQADVEEICEAFETARQRGESPEIAAALPGRRGQERLLVLRELIAIERYYCSRQLGRAVTDEELLERHPSIRDELANELTAQSGGDTRPDTPMNSEVTTIPPRAQTAQAAPVRFDSFPAEFGRYRLLKRLGAGGMGSVYLAKDTQLERQVALKLPQLDTSANPALIERFRREAKAAATLRHANLCAVYDAGEVDGTHFLTMEYIEGDSLAQVLRSGQRPDDQNAVQLIRTIALALHEVHRNGVVHRDLKPANIMIDASGQPIVTDFGLARRQTADSDDASQITNQGEILGTPSYMSPEQVEGDLDRVGPASDVYSLGVILFELLTGQRPFQGSPSSVLVQVMTGEPPTMSSLRDSVDPELESLCRRMMARSIDERYPSMGAVAEAADSWLQADRASDDQPPRRRIGVAAAVTGLVALLLAIYVFRIKTPEGEIVVESEVPGVTVSVIRDGDDVQSGWQLKQGTNTTTVQTGRIEITLPTELQNTFTIDQHEFTLRDNETMVVRVTRRPAVVDTAPAESAERELADSRLPQQGSTPVTTRPLPDLSREGDLQPLRQDSSLAPAHSLDREVAEWVSGHGGRVYPVDAGGDPGEPIDDPSQLPTEPFYVQTVERLKVSAADLDQLQRICMLPGLRGLSFAGEGCPSGLFGKLSFRSRIRVLTISGTGIRVSELFNRPGLETLSELSLSGNQIDDMEFPQRFPGLRMLRIYGNATEFLTQLASSETFRNSSLRMIILDFQTAPSDLLIDRLQQLNPRLSIVRSEGAAPQYIGNPVQDTALRRLLEMGFEIGLSSPTGITKISEVKELPGDWRLVMFLNFPRGLQLTPEIMDHIDRLSPVIWVTADSVRHVSLLVDSLDHRWFTFMSLKKTDLTDENLEQIFGSLHQGKLAVHGSNVSEQAIRTLMPMYPLFRVHSSYGEFAPAAFDAADAAN